MNFQSDNDYMKLAIQLAEFGKYTTSPNPMVGCVLVKDNKIVGDGYHQRAGEPHAEVLAIDKANNNACGSTAYITLEPCCHHGKTPPCTDALIQAGIKKVVVACLDPNPKMSGKGIKVLIDAGIEVAVGCLEQEAKNLNEIFFHFMTSHRPFVIAKWAMSLDGKTITHHNDERDISSSLSKEAAHTIRKQVDAIIVGANTARLDNPLLTARLGDNIEKQPIRIVVSSNGKLRLDLNLFNPSLPAKTIIATTNKIEPDQKRKLNEMGVETIILPTTETGFVSISALIEALGQREIMSVLVEGGMKLHESFFNEGLINKIQVYLAPVIIGSLEKKMVMREIKVTPMMNDLCLTIT